jgi:hypothetical protein
MTEQELKTALNKLFKIMVPKKFGDEFSDIEVTDVTYTPNVDDVNDDGEWISGDVYEISVKMDSLQTWSDLKQIESYLTNLIQSMVGKSNWIYIHFD